MHAGRDKGPIAIKITLSGVAFIQTLVKYSGKWRLYLNTPMRKAAGIDVGDIANVKIAFDPKPRVIAMHPKLTQALKQNKKAKETFEKLPPYRQKEIVRYISFMKSEETLVKNVK